MNTLSQYAEVNQGLFYTAFHPFNALHLDKVLCPECECLLYCPDYYEIDEEAQNLLKTDLHFDKGNFLDILVTNIRFDMIYETAVFLNTLDVFHRQNFYLWQFRKEVPSKVQVMSLYGKELPEIYERLGIYLGVQLHCVDGIALITFAEREAIQSRIDKLIS